MDHPDFSDPSWFPANYLPTSDEFRMIRLDIATIGSSSFLDDRVHGARQEGMLVKADAARPAKRNFVPAFLFHTAFCGSTLLARSLHGPPAAVSLKEPSVLLNLSSESLTAHTGPALDRLNDRLGLATALLSRPWTPEGRVLIKPTNQVNRLIPDLLRLQPEARAVLLYSTLEEFVVSCFKKLPLAETRIRWMAQHLLVGSDLAQRLDIPPLHAFSLPESCVFAWYTQIERYAKALDADDTDRLRTLVFQTMLDEPLATVRAAANWLDMPHALEDADRRVPLVFERDSKTTNRYYNPAQRDVEKSAVTRTYGDVIARTLKWAETTIAPHAKLPERWKPLSIR